MKRLDRILLPILTCLVVLVALLFPQRLSQWRDEAVLNSPHTEELKTENELPTQALTIQERMLLVAQYNEGADMTALVQELEWDSETENLVWKELEGLCKDGILPPEVLPEDLTAFPLQRCYLRSPEEIRGASFLVVEGYSKKNALNLSLALDEETGAALWLEADSPFLRKFDADSLAIGSIFLARLGLENVCENYSPQAAQLTLPGAD
ncbi:hypothetical protein [uncultured Dysosmobacter sp.]|uniref:hypothetical protein n=1 Tax=uncultured Dysosmobacter sp. TaxID=2591384 RepID=UPI00263A020D|nr:hypothetical protein [uncultured Dysosmobacter sp.]